MSFFIDTGQTYANCSLDTRPPPPCKPNNSVADDEEYKSEEHDKEENNDGYFPSAVCG